VNLARWAAVALCLGTTTPAQGQQEQGPPVGQRAPDFTLPAATRAGVQKRPVRLADFKGKTVVLAFFYKVRTKG
jgi:cytochrome oxidase Cu insertion factor (SCO1/SenC/PrrC family)